MELQGAHTRGMMVVEKRNWLPMKEKNVEIINSVDIDFVKLLIKYAFGHK